MTTTPAVADIHIALVRVVAEWSQSDLQRHVAEAVDVELDPTALRALYLLGMNGGAMGSGELARHGSMTRPTTSKLVARMAAQGVVEPVRSGRTVEVRLTAAGTRAYDRLVTAGHGMVGEALTGWTTQEIAGFQRQLVRFVAGLSGAGTAPHIKEES